MVNKNSKFGKFSTSKKVSTKQLKNLKGGIGQDEIIIDAIGQDEIIID